jgi:hypothetical protein
MKNEKGSDEKRNVVAKSVSQLAIISQIASWLTDTVVFGPFTEIPKRIPQR